MKKHTFEVSVIAPDYAKSRDIEKDIREALTYWTKPYSKNRLTVKPITKKLQVIKQQERLWLEQVSKESWK